MREKEFLSQKGIPFVEKNVREDQVALRELMGLGYRSTPVTLIDGEAVVGFDPGMLDGMLGE